MVGQDSDRLKFSNLKASERLHSSIDRETWLDHFSRQNLVHTGYCASTAG
jgi:hypothetical protein